MKLRNKKTGEIIELLAKPSFVKRNDDYLQSEVNTFNSLAKLNEEWEDAPEEPKKYWYLNSSGEINSIYEEEEEEEDTKTCKEVGNYFKTREEAEKAVEKLKAWKRLRNNGFTFEGTNNSKRRTGYFINYSLGKSFNSQDECEQAMKDLHLLFGGEE